MREILNEQPQVEFSGSRHFNPQWSKLKINNVTFSYQGKKILDNFSLSIKKGEKVGIVGISGTGKSTLFKLLLMLYEDYSGTISFDKALLKDIRRNSYIKHLAVVPQETELFNLSLKDNITIAGKKRRFNKSLLEQAIEVAHVKDFLEKLPNGLNALIGEKGVKLSGGERQRVGIARAVYRDPDILLLDEATSHLDVVSERKIQDALNTFLNDVTAIVIAHRLSTLRQMDKIVVMQKGKVVEVGSFKDLLVKQGVFWQLWKEQGF